MFFSFLTNGGNLTHFCYIHCILAMKLNKQKKVLVEKVMGNYFLQYQYIS